MTRILCIFIVCLTTASVSFAIEKTSSCRFLLKGSYSKPLYVKTFKNYGSAYDYEPNNGSSYEHRPRQRVLNKVIEAHLKRTNMEREWLHIGYTIKKFDLETILLAIGGRKFKGFYKSHIGHRIQNLYKFIFSSDFSNKIIDPANLKQDITQLYTMKQLTEARIWIFEQYPDLARIDFSSVNSSNINEFLHFFKVQLGEELLIARVEHEYFDFPEKDPAPKGI